MAFDRLIANIEKKQNPTVVGLDPQLSFVPDFLKAVSYERYGRTPEGAADAILQFNKQLIDAIYDIVPAVKPQAAYYEQFGWQGIRAMYETITYAKQKGMFVIIDGKRGDIGSTMEAYAAAHLGETDVDGESFVPFGGDALTVNGYLGTDGIKPLLSVCEKHDTGIFVLVKTSNPSGREVQDLSLAEDRKVYHAMGELCETWGKSLPGMHDYSGVGAVVGATHPAQLTELRQCLPSTFFLVPGYGAQGGGANDVAGAFDTNGLGAIVNSSRAVIAAWKKSGLPEEEFAQAARNEAVRMKDDLLAVLPDGKIRLT